MTRWLMVLILTVTFSLSAFAGAADRWQTSEYAPGSLLVKFADSVRPHVPATDNQGIVRIGIPSLDDIFQEFEVTSAERLVPDGILARLKTPPDLYNTYVLNFRPEYPALEVLERLAADANVVEVEPDLMYHTCRVPNDAFWNSQWDKSLIGCPDVWDVSTGDSSIILCAIDTGTDWRHPDLGMMDTLQPDLGWVLWVNPGEDLDQNRLPYQGWGYPGDVNDLNGVDDDANGYVDDFLGWDFVHGVGGCYPGEDCDSQMDNNMFGLNPHGTHVGGIMTAHGNNGIGVTGVNWGARLMGLRAGYLTSDGMNGLFQNSAILSATYYAAANGAKVINMSFGGAGYDPNLQTAINTAWNQGVVIVAASGNSSSQNPSYPAAYQHVIAVNSTDSDDHLSYFSNYGTWTDISAPGGSPGIWSTLIDNSYGGGTWEGTSMASPNVAGVIGLLWSIFPTMTNAEISDFVINHARDISALNPGIPLGSGRVDAMLALASVFPHLRVPGLQVNDSQGGDGDNRLENGETAQVVFTVANDSGWSAGTDVTVTVSTNDSHLSVTNGSFTLTNIPPGGSANNQSNPISVSASGVGAAYWAVLTLNFSSPNGYHSTTTAQLRVGRGDLLIVDDDGGANFQTYYVASVDSAGLNPDIWTTLTDGALSAAEASHYSTIIWSCGNESSNTLTAGDQSTLTQFLTNHGNLLLVGQNIPEDIGSSSFHTDYLHAQDEHMAGNRQLGGIPGNPISDGDSLLLIGGNCAGNGQLSPSRIIPINGAQAVFNYTDGGVGSVMFSGDYKVVYCSFALEAACGLAGTVHHRVVIQHVLNWFGVTDVPSRPGTTVPSKLALKGNYPNPFNPTTTIAFDLPANLHVVLNVYDILGREVATLVNGPIAAGTHEARFDGSNLASGVYIVRLTAGANAVSSKMLLLK